MRSVDGWLAAMVALGAVAAAPVRAAESQKPGEWLMARHDARQTNWSPLHAKMASPAVRWRIALPSQLGGLVAADVDLDGNDDLLTLNAGRAATHTANGKLLWQTASLGLTSLYAGADFDGDGARDVLAVAPTRAYLLRLATGDVWWSSPAGAYLAIATAAAADFTGDGTVDLALGDASGPASAVGPQVTVYAFSGSKGSAVAATDMPGAEGHFPWGGHLHAIDVDGDGATDLVPWGDKRVGAFSGKTGKRIGLSPELSPLFVFQPVQAWRPPGAGAPPHLVWPSSNPGGGGTQQQVGWYVLQLQGSELALRWKYQAAVPADEAVAAVPGSVGDLDGDGMGEFVVSQFSSGSWRLTAFDLATGATLTTLAAEAAKSGASIGPVLQGTIALPGGKVALVVSLQAQRMTSPFGPQRLLTWDRKTGFATAADFGPGEWWAGNRPAAAQPAPAYANAAPLLALEDGKPAAELLMQRDTDGDLRGDRIERLRWGPAGVTVLADAAMPPTAGPIGVLRRGSGLSVVLAAADGRVHQWNASFKLVNDGDGDGAPDLVRHAAGAVQLAIGRIDAAGAPVIAMTHGPLVRAFSLAGAGPATPPALLWSHALQGPPVSLNLADTTGDGQREVVVGLHPPGKTFALRGLSASGGVAFNWSPPGPLRRAPPGWGGALVHDVDGDGADDLLIRAPAAEPTTVAYAATSVWSGKGQTWLWPAGKGCAAVPHAEWGLDTAAFPPRVVGSPWMDRIVCAAASGEALVQVAAQPGTYGTPMVAALTGKAVGDWVMGGAAGGPVAVDGESAKNLWYQEDLRFVGGPSALVQTDSGWVSLHAAPGAAELQARDAAKGTVLWARVVTAKQLWPVGSQPAHATTIGRMIAVGGISGPGAPTVVVTTSEGLVYAIGVGDASIAWIYDAQGTVGALAAADVDGDGANELVAAMPNGELVALDGNVAAPPPAVRDNAAPPEANPATDIDEQESAEQAWASWEPAAGAKGYVARLVDDTGGQVASAAAFAGAAASLNGLYLQPGRTYHWAVASHASEGADASFSTETLSDGVQVVDASPPWFADPACAPGCALAQGALLRVTATARDRTRLAEVRLTLARIGATPPLAQERWLHYASSFAVDWQSTLADPGDYRVTLFAADIAGHSTATELAVTVCAKGLQAVGHACKPPPPKPAGPVALSGSHADGCGSRPATTGAGGWVAACAGLMWAVGRRKRCAMPPSR
ncbi:MAG: hypothetical protein FJ100_11985 [Deltaproteobacteria bacterium]|nr:hypothetical protein [Deltaproteobacteria bacterium]